MGRLKLLVAASAVAFLVAGCTNSGSPEPAPTTTAGGPTGSGPASTTAGATGSSGSGTATPDDPALDACDGLGIMPCARQVAKIALPIAGTSIALTYSSDRSAGRTQDAAPSAAAVGLAGWTLSVLDTYDPASKKLITGNGFLRVVTGVAAGTRTAVADLAGRTVDLFDSAGRLTSVVDATTGATEESFAWGDHGLTEVSDSSGPVLTVTRAPDGTPVRLSVPKGAATGLGTVSGRLAAVVYPDGSRARIATGTSGLVQAWANAAGRLTSFSFDQEGRLASTTDGSGAQVSYQRELSGHTLTVTTTKATGGEVVDSVSADGPTTTFSHTDATGSITKLAAEGNRRTITKPDGTVTTMTIAPDPRWGPDAPLVSLATTGKATVSQTATASPISRTITVAGSSWTFRYDPASRTATTTDPTTATSTTTYDSSGRVVTTNSGGVPVNFAYGDQNRISSITIGTGPDARTWTYRRAGGVLSITDPIGQVSTRTLTSTGAVNKVSGPGASGLAVTRDAADRVTAFAAPVGGQYQLTWGAGGKVAAVNAPAGTGGPQFTGYDYDKSGNLIKRFTANTALTINRDAAGRIDSYNAGAGDVAAAYDAAGRLTTLTSGTSTVSDSYTGAAVTSEKVTGPVSSSVARTLDPAGRTASIAVTGGQSTAYGYDAASRVDKAGDLTLQRDQTTGLVSSEKLGALTAVFTRNQFGELKEEKVTGAGGAAVADVVDTRDGLGRLTAVATTAAGHTTTSVYTYDSAGRLATESIDGRTTRYGYDAAGNITSVTDPSGTVTTSVYDGRNALIKQGNTTFTYDGAGQLATTTSSAGTTTYHYDGAGRLLSVDRPGQPALAYTIDGFGRRIATSNGAKITDGLAYLDSIRPAAQLDASGNVTRQFVYSGLSTTPDYVVAAGIDYLEIPDASGGPALAVNATTGTVADRLVRSAFGAVVSETTPGFQAIGYGGGITDPATGLVHFGARDYDPATGRWTAPDPLSVAGGSANLYQYVSGDPVNRNDPSGQCDYSTVSITGAAGVGVGGSLTYGIVFTDGGIGIYETGLVGPGLGGGVTIDFGCSDNVNNTNPTPDDISGPSASATGGFGPGGVGPDFGYNSDGTPSTVGGHVSIGPDVGIGGGGGYTIVGCLVGCNKDSNPDYGTSSDDNNPNADGVPDCPGGICDPNGSDAGPPDNNPSNACDGGDCSDPSDPNSGNGDSPPGDGPRSTGDPHLRTADGLRYDMQAVGEFTWLASDSGDLDVQVRQQPLTGSQYVSLTTAVAMSIAGDHLMITDPGGYQQPMTVALAGGTIPLVGRFALPHGATVVRSESQLEIILADGGRVWVQTNPRGLNVNASLPDARHGKVSGLVGPFTGAETPVAQTKDGKSFTLDQLGDYTTLYNVFANSWRIPQTASLFTDDPGHDATAFDDPTFPHRNPPAIPAATSAAAQAVCAQLDLPPDAVAGCVEDVALTGDAGFASSLASSIGSVPGGPSTTASPPAGGITAGSTISGSVTAGSHTTYSVTVAAGTVGYFAAAPGCTNPATGDILWYFRDPSGATFTGASEICNDQGRVVFTKAGTYQLVVESDNGGSGAYSVTWKISRPDITRTLTPGSTVSGTIDLPGAKDVYRMTVAAGTVAYLAAAPGCTDPPAGKGSVYWNVNTPDGNSFTGASEICNDQGRVVFTKAGSYQLTVSSSDGGMAAYSLTWKASRPDRVIPLLAGNSASGTIDLPGARDMYTIAVTSGTVAYFAAAAGCTSGTNGSLEWYLNSPDGGSFTGASDICSDEGRVQFTKPGTYQLMVISADGATGAYSITWKQSRPDLVQPLALGSQLSGNIDRPGAHDLWTFTVPAGGKLKFSAAPGCTSKELYWAVQTVDGGSFSSSDLMCNDLGEIAFPAGGSYRLQVWGDQTTTGAYAFSATSG